MTRVEGQRCPQASLSHLEDPYPPNLGGGDSPPPNSGGESSENPCFTVFSGEHSLNLGGRSGDSPPPISGGESSENPCFTVFSGDFTP